MDDIARSASEDHVATTEVVPPRPGDVAVVVLTHDGVRHLPDCLDAVLSADGIAGPEAIVVVDNASVDGTPQLMADRYPSVRTLRFEVNLGFAGGYNRALATMDEPWILLLNDDTAISRTALALLCSALSNGGVIAGARLVDWFGRRLDFDGGAAGWTGHGHALGHGQRVPRADARGLTAAELMAESRTRAESQPPPASQPPPDPQPPPDAQPTLFCSGAAMLVHRETFLALGGFDERYFAYYEDVDLGWRMNLAGLDPLHVPDAVVRHRGGGSATALATGHRALLHERNALATVAKNWSATTLERALPAALALAAVRAGAPMAVIAAAARMPAADGSPWPASSWPGWEYLSALQLEPQTWLVDRERVQALRRRDDAEMVARLGRAWAPVPPTAAGWAALYTAADAFGLEEYFGSVSDSMATPRPLAERLAVAWSAGGAAGVARAGRGWLARWLGGR